MECIDIKELLEYLQGKKTEDLEMHLSDCNECRTRLLKLLAEQNADFQISPLLEKNTIYKIIIGQRLRSESNCADTHVRLPFFSSKLIKVALAAGIALLLISGISFLKRPMHGSIANSANHGIQVPEKIGKAFEKEIVTYNEKMEKTLGIGRKNNPIVFDSILITKETITVAKDKEALLRFDKGSGIIAESSAKLTVQSRTDTSASVELTSGVAFFSIEKHRYRHFIVKTPNASIIVTGTVFTVMVDKEYTMVNVLEGSVQLRHQQKSTLSRLLDQGSQALVDRDSIVCALIENSTLYTTREKLLREYIEGTIFHSDFEK